MEMLQKQLADLPKRVMTLSGKGRFALFGGIAVAIALAVAVPVLSNAEAYQYAFTNLTSEDSGEASAILKTAQIPFRLEAGGTALSVPAAKVHEARLLLATAGLPRGGGTGFELFDRGDLGVSEFTQKVNLRRATEGELARSIGRLAGVRSARVHLTLAEKGLFRDDSRAASAAVVLNLQPGRTLDERELAGVRHLVASAVPGLAPNSVTIVDGRGSVLAAESTWGEEVGSYQRKLERDLEQRIVGILEPAVGVGEVVARVTASVDSSEVNTLSDVVDPEATVLRNERTVAQNQNQDSTGRSGIAGAAANQPLTPQASGSPGGNKSSSSSQEETRNYEISKTTTKTVTRTPRLQRISVAILVDGVGGKPRDDAEVARLGVLARSAVGINSARGDVFSISSAVFSRSTEEASVAAPPSNTIPKTYLYGAAGLGALVILVLGVLLARRGRAEAVDTTLLRPGAKVAELENPPAEPKATEQPKLEEPAPAPVDPALAFRDRARELAKADPVRAAHLLRAWIASDGEVARG